ncbi:MAG: phenylalanine--tRNA ligase subunit beta [Oscillospiraceae bacterium]|nr:phenylalanine--tRNA ligase subunit beta [Oscillospiraceae bacterium]
MDLSRNWLNEFVSGVSADEIDDKAFSEAMTISGSKVETYRYLGEEIENVVVGRVLSLARHPDSDHMWVVQVDAGGDAPVQIVTGAWNVHAGDLVPVALHGARLPGGKKIERGKLRGVLSDGMLCGLAELGLDERDFPYAAVTAAAILGDYHPLDPAKPSISADIQPGDTIYGPVVCARVVEDTAVSVDIGGAIRTVKTPCSNLHEGDLIAYHTANNTICTLADLHAQSAEFPHCIPDGIFILQEECRPGDDIRAVTGLDDHVVEFEITPNRPDCLSVIGLAREAAATFQKELRLHEPQVKGGAEGVLPELLDVETPDADLVPRYTARMVRNVKIAPSPKWMRQRLRAMGVRPINNIVDITNYVMMEYGQPMHAFDYRYVKGGKIIVRRAQEGEELTTLDGIVRKLNANHLVIADETRAVGLAGIMGGENSEIVADTADVVFESANFDGTCIRKGALALGMRTEASAKFEKGLDPMNTLPAVNRACELVELLGAGDVVDGVIDIINYVPQPTVLSLRPDKINALLGTDLVADTMVSILRKLDFKVEGETVTVPSWRGDVGHYSDLAEEVARFYGYNNIPTTLMRGQTTRGGYSEAQQLDRMLGSVCRAAGYDEIITYSFISPAYYDKIRWAPDDPRRDSFRILNPLGEGTSIMRTTTLPSMLEVLARNDSYRNRNVRLYELGRTYHKRAGDELADERHVLTLGAYGDDMDFYVLKGAVDAICRQLRMESVRYEADRSNPSYHPGRCCVVYAGTVRLGTLGQIHPQVAAAYGVEQELYCAELDTAALLDCRGAEAEYRPLPRFPAVLRDIAVVCAEEIPVGALEDCIRSAGGALLKDVALFDVYRGPGIAPGKKSVAFNLTLRSDEGTITSEAADQDVAAILTALEQTHHAVLR